MRYRSLWFFNSCSLRPDLWVSLKTERFRRNEEGVVSDVFGFVSKTLQYYLSTK